MRASPGGEVLQHLKLEFCLITRDDFVGAIMNTLAQQKREASRGSGSVIPLLQCASKAQRDFPGEDTFAEPTSVEKCTSARQRMSQTRRTNETRASTSNPSACCAIENHQRLWQQVHQPTNTPSCRLRPGKCSQSSQYSTADTKTLNQKTVLSQHILSEQTMLKCPQRNQT